MHLTSLLRPMSECVTAAYLILKVIIYDVYLATGQFSLHVPNIKIL